MSEFPDPCLPNFYCTHNLRGLQAAYGAHEKVHIDYSAQFKVRGGVKGGVEGPASRVGGYSEAHIQKVRLVLGMRVVCLCAPAG